MYKWNPASTQIELKNNLKNSRTNENFFILKIKLFYNLTAEIIYNLFFSKHAPHLHPYGLI